MSGTEDKELVINKIKHKSLKEMRNFTEIKVHSDINEPTLLGYDKWPENKDPPFFKGGDIKEVGAREE